MDMIRPFCACGAEGFCMSWIVFSFLVIYTKSRNEAAGSQQGASREEVG